VKIHVVRQGETLSLIAQQYQISQRLLSRENQVDGTLVVGQTLVVPTPDRLHTVAAGETLSAIARQYQTDIRALYQNNYFLMGQPALTPGEELVISQTGEKLGKLAVNGYAYPYISRELLYGVTPYLSYLAPFTYGVSAEGKLLTLNDEALLTAAARQGAGALMHLSTLTETGGFDSARAELVLTNPMVQRSLITQVTAVMQEKGYRGLDVDFEFIPSTLAQAYADFITALGQTLHPLGYFVVVALAPKTGPEQRGLLYEAHSYEKLGAAADGVLLMTYEWGYTYGPPMAVAPLPSVKRVLDYALTVIPPEKIYLGVPNYGYDWPLPFARGESRAQSIAPQEGIALAQRYNAEIFYDETACAPFFHYTDSSGQMHEVWFEDARSVEAKVRLATENRLTGVGIWNVMREAPQLYLTISGLTDIETP
jgi:spore germination protein